MGGSSQTNTGGSAVCKRCKKIVSNGVNCTTCSSVFHPSCFKSAKCCENINCSELSNENLDIFEALKEYLDENNKIDIKIVKCILYQNQVIISELRDKVNLLNKHVDLLDKLNVKKNIEAASESQSIKCKSGLNTERTAKDKTTVSTINLVSNTENKENSTGEIVNEISQNKESWSQVVARKKNNRPTIVGISGKVSDKVKGVSKPISLHVYRLTPDTEQNDIIQFLKPVLPVLSCEKLNSRQPEIYSSFKIDIAEEHSELAFNPNTWPAKACVRRFFHPRPRVADG